MWKTLSNTKPQYLVSYPLQKLKAMPIVNAQFTYLSEIKLDFMILLESYILIIDACSSVVC